jgi:hypothetical protein
VVIAFGGCLVFVLFTIPIAVTRARPMQDPQSHWCILLSSVVVGAMAWSNPLLLLLSGQARLEAPQVMRDFWRPRQELNQAPKRWELMSGGRCADQVHVRAAAATQPPP